MNLYELIEQEGMVEVAELSNGGGYEWDDIKVWWHPTNNRFYWLRESGCSCSYWGDYGPYSLGDFEDGDRQSAMSALKRFGASFDESEAAIAAVRDYKREVAE